MSFKVNTSVPSEELANAPAVMDTPKVKLSSAPTPAPIQQETVSESVSSETTPEVTEAAVTPEAKVEEKTISPQYAQIAKRERMVRRQLEELKQREAAFKNREQDLLTRYVPKDQIAEDFRTDPLGSMKKYNLSYDQLTAQVLNGPTPQEQTVAELRREIAALKGGMDETKELITKQEAQRYEQAIHQIRTETKVLVENDPNFEMVKEMRAGETVVELIQETFKKTGTVMSVEEAAREVEEYLLEEILRVAKGKKIQGKMMSTPAAATEPMAQTNSAKTLTHASLSSGSKGLSNYERAMLAFKGELK